MTTSIFSVVIGGKVFTPVEQNNNNPAWQPALSDAHLKGKSFCMCTSSTDLQIIVRRYGASTEREHYGLARAGGTGLNHDSECRFFGEGSDDGNSADVLPAFEDNGDGTTRAHLAFSLQVAEAVEPSDTPTVSGGKSGAHRRRVSETTMMSRLWRDARLNVHRQAPRKWHQVVFVALAAAKKIVIGRSGETLADYLLIASDKGDKVVNDHNTKVLAKVKEKPSRLLVLGRMYLPKPGNKLLPVRDFQSLPKAVMQPDVIDSLLSRRPLVRKILETPKMGSVVVMACIQPGEGDSWDVQSIPVIPVGPGFIPAESSYEIEFANYLIEHGRHFIKPMVVAELGDVENRPDYILLDTAKQIPCEVWGMQAAEYLKSKNDRIANYDVSGQEIVSWTAEPREEFPPLPAESATKE